MSTSKRLHWDPNLATESFASEEMLEYNTGLKWDPSLTSESLASEETTESLASEETTESLASEEKVECKVEYTTDLASEEGVECTTDLASEEEVESTTSGQRISYGRTIIVRTIIVSACFSILAWITSKEFGASHPLMTTYFLLNCFLSSVVLLFVKCHFPVVNPIYVLILFLAVWSITYLIFTVIYLISINTEQFEDDKFAVHLPLFYFWILLFGYILNLFLRDLYLGSKPTATTRR